MRPRPPLDATYTCMPAHPRLPLRTAGGHRSSRVHATGSHVSSPAPALPRAQNDIKAHGKLNFHLYLALKKALYKPSAFFKGVLLPLCEGRCTVREALILSSVLQKVSVPMLHSAVAIMKLAEMPFTPANAIFLRTLLLKKYALPYRVVDTLVDYFASFVDATEVPPVLWQQTLLAFAQHYKARPPSPLHGAHRTGRSTSAADDLHNLSIHRITMWNPYPMSGHLRLRGARAHPHQHGSLHISPTCLTRAAPCPAAPAVGGDA